MITPNFVTPTEAKELLLQEDDYLQKIDKYNLKLFGFKDKEKMKLALKGCAQEFPEDEKNYIINCLKSFNQKFIEMYPQNKDKLDINFIFSDGRECGLPYTRNNFIVLVDMAFQSSHMIFHEMFHVISRQNPEFQSYLYEQLGFKNHGHDILNKHNIQHIINPDAPNNNYYIELDGLKVTPYAKTMDVRKLSFIILDEKNNVVICNAEQIKKVSDQYYNLFEPVSYLLHPEEILAEAWSAFWHRQLDMRSHYTQFLKNDSHLYKVIQDSLERYVLVNS